VDEGDESGSGPEVSPDDVRDYIHDMLTQLADLASSQGEGRLAVTLRMAAHEARTGQSNRA